MNTGISKKVFITANVFSGLLGITANAETSKERLVICGILGACFALYLVIQGVLDYSKKEKGSEA